MNSHVATYIKSAMYMLKWELESSNNRVMSPITWRPDSNLEGESLRTALGPNT